MQKCIKILIFITPPICVKECLFFYIFLVNILFFTILIPNFVKNLRLKIFI